MVGGGVLVDIMADTIRIEALGGLTIHRFRLMEDALLFVRQRIQADAGNPHPPSGSSIDSSPIVK
jgi:hypothetical protein